MENRIFYSFSNCKYLPIQELVFISDIKICFKAKLLVKYKICYEFQFFFSSSEKWELKCRFTKEIFQGKPHITESVTQSCSVKKVFFEISQITTVWETLAQVFSCEFCKISENIFSYRAPPVASSDSLLKNIVSQ